MLTAEQIRQFHTDGFVVIRDVIAPSDLERYRKAYERMVEKVRRNPEGDYGTRYVKHEANLRANLQGQVKNDEVWGCNALLHPDLYEEEFTDYLNNNRLLSALGSILGEELRVAGLKAIWSPLEVDYDLIWHRDGPDDMYSADGSQAHIQFNTALNRDESFRVVRGSHLRPLTPLEQEQSRKGVAPLPDEVQCVLEPGDVLFMHSMTFHRGRAPVGSNRRTLHYIIARKDKPIHSDEYDRLRDWYHALKLEDALAPTAKKLFHNLFAWEGKTIKKEPGSARSVY